MKRERESESLHAKLRKWMDFFDGLANSTIARFFWRLSPNNHLMSRHTMSQYVASSLPIAVSPSISVSHTTQKKARIHTHDTLALTRGAICKNRKWLHSILDPHFDCYCCCFSVASSQFLNCGRRRLLNKKMGFMARVFWQQRERIKQKGAVIEDDSMVTSMKVPLSDIPIG